TQPIALDFTTADLSGWTDLPPGTYRVPDSQVIISGHQKGGIAPVLLFGVVGLGVQSAVNSNSGKNATKDSADVLRIHLTSQAQDAAKALLTAPRFAQRFPPTVDSSPPKLSISTAVAMTYETDTDVLPFVVLKVSLLEPKAKDPRWTSRYIASTGATRPLTGDGSWTANGGKDLLDTLALELNRAITAMLTDVAAPFPRDDAKLTMLQGHFPFVKKRLQTVGYELTEDSQTISYVPKLGDVIVFSGVNIMDKSAVVYREAAKGDPALKALDN